MGAKVSSILFCLPNTLLEHLLKNSYVRSLPCKSNTDINVVDFVLLGQIRSEHHNFYDLIYVMIGVVEKKLGRC